ncbi:Reverse transcriptase domain-containing protein [Strongyloides ratti]|uniref:Reverse transcriptase domain-containing protein n=1 Tax=Strongyloides ratti TaxID=34506 RepID=A0A090KT18_STRRB|nr:Reverse transcriptase domain-containing protein [Strongyloides ratti]CEF60640.1 Reverse transcriptase domain-containing protein [Strongyloides ratti]
MDDLKLYANDRESQKQQIRTLNKLSNNIGLNINNKKCATLNTNNDENPVLGFPLITKNESYKYLGITQNDLTDLTSLENKLTIKILEILTEVNRLNLPLRFVTKLIANTLKLMIEYLATDMIFGESRNQRINVGMINLGIYAYISTDPKTNILTKYLGYKYDPLTIDNRLRTSIEDSIYLLNKMGITTDTIRNNSSIKITINSEEANIKLIKGLISDKILENNKNELTKSKYYKIFNRYKLDNHTYKFLTTNINSNLEQLICHAQEKQLFFENKFCRMKCPNKETLEHILTSCIHKDTIRRLRHDNVLRLITTIFFTKLGIRTLEYGEKLTFIPSKNLYIDWAWKKAQVKSHKPDLVYLPLHPNKPLIILDVSIANLDNITNQEKWKFTKYCTNSNIEFTDDWLLAGYYLADYLRKKFNRKTEFLPVVVGFLGELMEESIQNVNKTLELTTKEANQLWTNINISVIRDTYRLLKQHYGKINH